MDSLRTVIAATDLSSGAQVAEERAAQLAQAHRASLHLVHAVDEGAWHSLREIFDLPRFLQDPVPELGLHEQLAARAQHLRERFGVLVVP